MQPYETSEFYFNKKFQPRTFHDLQPIYFSVPVVAFRVRYVEIRNPDNIIEQTIFKLKKISYGVNRIANALCLDPHIIQSVLKYYNASEDADGTTVLPQKMVTGYLLYDCYGERFFDEVIPEEVFGGNTDLYLEERNKYTYKFKESLSASRYYIVRPLQKPDGYSPPPSPTQEKMLSVLMERDAKISSDFYAHAEYLNEQRMLQLVCTVYVDNGDCSALNVSNAVRANDIRLRIQFEKILEKYKEANSFLAERVNQLKENVVNAITDITSEKWEKVNKETAHAVIEKYGTALRRYDRVFRKVCDLETANTKLKNAQNDFFSEAYMAACNGLKTASHHLLEETLIASFFRYYDDTARKHYGHLNKNNAGRELLWGYLRATGFDADESKKQKFMNGVTVECLNRDVFSQGELPKEGVNNPRINLWLIANVMLGRIQKNHPVIKLAERRPRIVEALGTTLHWRNDAAHDSSDKKPDFFSVDQANELVDFCELVLRTMLGLEHCGGKIADVQNAEADPSLKLPIQQDMKDITTQNDEIVDKIEKTGRAFYRRDATFFESASNFLHAVCRGYLAPLYDKETHRKILESFPEDIAEGNLLINRILSANGISYEVKAVVNKRKLNFRYEEIEKCTSAAILYIFICFIEKKRPLLFANIPDFCMLAEITDEVIARRGHNESADFATHGEEYEKLYRILLKIAKEYKE